MQEPELTAKMLGKLFQDLWLKDSAYQEWVLKDKLDKHYAGCVACEISSFLCVPYQAVVMVLTRSLFGSSPSPWEPCQLFCCILCEVPTDGADVF